VAIEKEFVDKKPHTVVRLSKDGRAAFDDYRRRMKQTLDDLPAGNATPDSKNP
jgi:hypothetical protein